MLRLQQFFTLFVRTKILFLTLAMVSHATLAQKYSFVEYGTEKGIPQSQITSLVQDSAGYMWIGTLGGLARFNGNQFEVFTNSNGLLNNKITFLGVINNQLWVGHEGGISIQEGKTFNAHSLGRNQSTVQVSGFLKFRKHNYVSTNGAGLYILKNNKFTEVRLPFEESDRIRDLAVVQGELFVGTRGGVLRSKDGQNFSWLKGTEGYSVADLLADGDELYICAYQDGLKRWNSNTQKLHTIELSVDFSPRGITKVHSGDLWVSSNTGVIFGKEKRWQVLTTEKGLPINDIRVILEDDEQRVWLGSLGKGLIYFPGEQFVYFDKSSGMSTDLILSVNRAPRGLYLGSYDQGLIEKIGDEFKLTNKDHLTIWCTMRNVADCDWFGTETGLLRRKSNGQFDTWRVKDGLLSDKVTCLLKISSEEFLIAGAGGIQAWRSGQWKTIHDNQKNNIGTVRKMVRNSSTLYVASDRGFFKSTENGLVQVLNFNQTSYALLEKNGDVFIGSEDGLYLYRKDSLTEITLSELPSGRFVTFLNSDQQRLYVGTNNGLYTYAFSSGEVQHYGVAEGLPNVETNVNSGFVDGKNFWFGTASGFVLMRTDFSPPPRLAPRISSKGILVNYQPSNAEWNSPKVIKLPFRQNNLTFQFDALSFSQPDNLHFQFFLEGVDEDWSPPTENASAVFSGLNPGKYRLYARVIAADGQVSETLSYSFEVMPPFYRTWWFYVLIATVFIFSVYWIFQTRLTRMRKANEMERMGYQSRLLRLEQQSLNASMNRHFIFNSLNSIQYFINTKDRESANRYLTNFAQLIRKNLDAAAEENNSVTLEKEVERMKLYLSLESMRFKDRFDYQVINHGVDLENVLIPSMLLQPFIENSIIHGILPNDNQKGMITIEIRELEGVLEIRLLDNGIGISRSLQSKQQFEGDHRSQGMEITAKRVEVLKKLSNQELQIIGPSDNHANDGSINGTYVLLKIPLHFVDNSD